METVQALSTARCWRWQQRLRSTRSSSNKSKNPFFDDDDDDATCRAHLGSGLLTPGPVSEAALALLLLVAERVLAAVAGAIAVSVELFF